MSDDLKTLVAQEVAKQLATFTADATVKKVLDFLKNRNSADAYVVETNVDGENWFRIWSDGFIEQGGKVDITSIDGNTFSFNRPFSNKSTVTLVALNGKCTNVDYTANLHTKGEVTVSTFYLQAKGYGGTGTVTDVNWCAFGY